MRLTATVALGAMLFTLASVASAQGESTEPPSGSPSLLRSWDAPESCIGEESLLVQVKVQLSADMAQRSIAASVETSEGGWKATLIVFEEEERLGQRVLELAGDDCRDHDETLALVIALLLEHGPPPQETAEEQEVESSESEPQVLEKPRDEQPEEQEISLRPESEPEPAEQQVRLRVGAALGVLDGWAPRTIVASQLRVGAMIQGTWIAEVEGSYFPTQNETVSPRGSVKSSGGQVFARACWLAGASRVRFPICGSGGWMFLSSRGRDVETPQTGLFGSPSGGLDLGVHWSQTEHWSLGAELRGLYAFKRAEYVFTSPSEAVQVHETKQLLLGGNVGMTLLF